MYSATTTHEWNQNYTILHSYRDSLLLIMFKSSSYSIHSFLIYASLPHCSFLRDASSSSTNLFHSLCLEFRIIRMQPGATMSLKWTRFFSQHTVLSLEQWSTIHITNVKLQQQVQLNGRKAAQAKGKKKKKLKKMGKWDEKLMQASG